MDKGTIIRTAALLLALTNQFLVLFGKSPLPIDSELVEQIISSIITLVTAINVWFRNNYVTKTGKKQRQVLERNGLTKKKKEKKQ
ncbi:phage holin [Oceanobacillus bengalensis]|uniref:Phage holin n=1 Tax=Oceanobacillus bengalensis TaxID=1435466 RepID=A0A494Z4T5_9BACI|nr:phage holin [Oceanobacillus bengalensis]RKQ17509.1 phage holin [Oceanobacillus bengalensis]